MYAGNGEAESCWVGVFTCPCTSGTRNQWYTCNTNKVSGEQYLFGISGPFKPEVDDYWHVSPQLFKLEKYVNNACGTWYLRKTTPIPEVGTTKFTSKLRSESERKK